MHTVTGKLIKQPYSAPYGDGAGMMWIIELSEMNKDYKTQEKSYTNYKAVFFAKSQEHINYYNQALVQDSVVVVSAPTLKIDKSFDGQNNEYIKLEMMDARLGRVYAPQQQAPQQQGGFQQQAPQQQGGFGQQNAGGFKQQAPQQQGGFGQQNSGG